MNLEKALKHISISIGVALSMMSLGLASGAPEGQAVEGLPTIFHKNARVLFQGDSIADGGRDRGGRYQDHAHGQGYPDLIAAAACRRFAELNLTFLNGGISGNKVADLAGRWQNDGIALKIYMTKQLRFESGWSIR